MEINKEAAIWARDIAERMLADKNFVGAKKLVLEVQSSFPELQGIPQMLAALNVYIAAENKINGETDWYGVLDVNPSADDESIRKQYKKLALVLHPDKNKYTGADGAFALLSEGWRLLSDKSKRLAYNMRRLSEGVQHNILMTSGAIPPSPDANGFHDVSKSATSSAEVSRNATQVQFSSDSRSQPCTNTFWTLCWKCRMHYEYLGVYLNHNLPCPNCDELFFSFEVFLRFKSSKSPASSSQRRNPSLNHCSPYVGAATGLASSIDTNAPQPQSSTEKLKRKRNSK